MGFARYEQTNNAAPAVFAYAGSGWTGGNAGNQSVSDTGASGGTYATTTHAGDTCTITVAAGNGKTGALLLGLATPTGGSATVTLDGVTVGTWNQSNGATTNSANYNWYQTCFPPLSWRATDPTGASTHTIVVTCASGSISVDAIDLFDTTLAPTASTILGFGHSIMYGYNPNTQGQYTTPFLSEVARRLNYTATNNGLSAEDLTNGRSGTNGPASANNPQMFSNAAVAQPGWARARGSAWATRQDELAVILHGRNDTGYTTLYDAPSASSGTDSLQTDLAAAVPNACAVFWYNLTAGDTFTLKWVDGGSVTHVTASTAMSDTAATVNARLAAASNGAIPYTCTILGPQTALAGATAYVFVATSAGVSNDVQVNTVTTTSGNMQNIASAAPDTYLLQTSAAITGGTFQITGSNLGACTINRTDSVATINTNLATAGLPYTITDKIGYNNFTTNPTIYTFAPNVATPTPITLSLANDTTTGGHPTLSRPLLQGRAGAPAGAGWALARFKQRLREMLWYRNLNCPAGLTFVMEQDLLDPATPAANALAYNAAIQAVVNESTVSNVYYVETITTSRSISGFINTDNVHPTQEGHYRLADPLVRAILRAKVPHRLGARR